MPNGRNLKQMHDVYRRMVESLPLCVYLAEFEPEGRWEFVSPQIEALTGYGQKEWLGPSDLWQCWSSRGTAATSCRAC